MKKAVGIIVLIAFIAAVVFAYMQMAKSTSKSVKTYFDHTTGYIDKAKKNVDALEKSTKNMADSMIGK